MGFEGVNVKNLMQNLIPLDSRGSRRTDARTLMLALHPMFEPARCGAIKTGKIYIGAMTQMGARFVGG